jgi:chondroitin sulfate proteoglycan 4
VFQIVTSGERLLTGRDLRYSDADVDTQPTDIVYTRRGIPNGGIYQASDPTVRYLQTRNNSSRYEVPFDFDT